MIDNVMHIQGVRLSVLVLLCILPFGSLQAQNKITWYNMKQAQQLARQHDKMILVFAKTDWNIYCQKMNKEVFPKQAVIDSMQAYFYPVKVNIESNQSIVLNGKRMTQREFAKRYKIHATPTTFFFDKDGKVLGGQPGFIASRTFSQLLAFIGSGAYKKMEFKDYLKENGIREQHR